MDVLTVAAVLSLLSVSAAVPLTCEDHVRPVALNKTQVPGNWFLIEATSDHEKFAAMLKIGHSSVMDVKLLSDNSTALIKLRDMVNGRCYCYGRNVTYSNSTFQFKKKNGSVTSGVFLPTCPDCLVVSLTGVDAGVITKSLYIFGRTKKMSQSDLEMYREQAKCLGLPQPSFKYDETRDICPEEQKPADTEKVEAGQKL